MCKAIHYSMQARKGTYQKPSQHIRQASQNFNIQWLRVDKLFGGSQVIE